MKIQNHEGEILEIEKSSTEAFEVLNHSTSHLLAQAIRELYPNAKFGFGPAIDEGFYYDIDFGDEQITEADLETIEKKMRELAKPMQKNQYGQYLIKVIDEMKEEVTSLSFTHREMRGSQV